MGYYMTIKRINCLFQIHEWCLLIVGAEGWGEEISLENFPSKLHRPSFSPLKVPWISLQLSSGLLVKILDNFSLIQQSQQPLSLLNSNNLFRKIKTLTEKD